MFFKFKLNPEKIKKANTKKNMSFKPKNWLRVLSSTFLLLGVNVSYASDYSRLIPSWLGTAVVIIVIVSSLSAFLIWKLKDFDKKWNDGEVDTNGIEKQFKESLQALAAPAIEQVKFTEPGDVPEEIMDDYLLWADSYRNNFSDALNPVIAKEIIDLEYLVNKLPESAFKDTNLESMNQPEWQFLRDKAKSILDKLNWPIEPPASYIDEGDGTYSRTQAMEPLKQKPINRSSYDFLKELPFDDFPLIIDFYMNLYKTETFGYQLVYRSKEHGLLSGFPWWDNIELEILSMKDIPLGTLEEPFDDLEQGWQKYIIENKKHVYILEGNDACCMEFPRWYKIESEHYYKQWQEVICKLKSIRENS